MKKFALLLLATCISAITIGDIIDTQGGVKDKMKLMKARMKYSNEDYKAALRLYRDVYLTQPENAELNFRIGQCHLSLGDILKALEYFEKSYKLDNFLSGIHLALGQAYHLKGDLTRAVEEYNKYKSKLSAGKLAKDDVVKYLKQCEYAKELMSKPVDVTLKNLGSNINSEYPDYSPMVIAEIIRHPFHWMERVLFSLPEDQIQKVKVVTTMITDIMKTSTYLNTTKPQVDGQEPRASKEE